MSDLPKVIVLEGPPSSGKGTLSKLFEKMGYEIIVTGDLLRAEVKAGSELGLQAKSYMDAGHLVPDNIVIGIIGKRVKAASENRFVLDGFPRTAAQAIALENIFANNGIARQDIFVIGLDVLDANLQGRMNERIAAAVAAGLPPRKDDNPATFRERLAAYHANSPSVREHFGARLHRVDGNGSIENTRNQALKALGIPPTPSEVDAGVVEFSRVACG